jgi:hypothetical protein
VTGSCEHGNEPLDSIKGDKFLDQLSEYRLLKKDPVPCSCAQLITKPRRRIGEVEV